MIADYVPAVLEPLDLLYRRLQRIHEWLHQLHSGAMVVSSVSHQNRNINRSMKLFDHVTLLDVLPHFAERFHHASFHVQYFHKGNFWTQKQRSGHSSRQEEKQADIVF